MTRLRARAGLVAMLALVAIGGVGLLAGSAAAKDTPILECVFKDAGTGQYNSLWGYDNSTGHDDPKPVGSLNSFSPTPENRGQPTVILQGTHHNAFVVTWNGSGSLTWNLDSRSATATKSSTACGSNPVPMTGDVAWYVLPGAMVGAGIAGLWLFRRRLARRGLGDLSGT
jgi:hypothetical protein